MRKLTVLLASLVLVLGLSFSAKADPTVDLIWTSSALGATGLGTVRIRRHRQSADLPEQRGDRVRHVGAEIIEGGLAGDLRGERGRPGAVL